MGGPHSLPRPYGGGTAAGRGRAPSGEGPTGPTRFSGLDQSHQERSPTRVLDVRLAGGGGARPIRPAAEQNHVRQEKEGNDARRRADGPHPHTRTLLQREGWRKTSTTCEEERIGGRRRGQA